MPVAQNVNSPSNLPKQLSDGGDLGTTLGLAPTGAQGGAAADKIGFFGSVSLQQSGAAQAAITRGLAFGQVTTFAMSINPQVVLSNTTTELAFTPISASAVWKIATNDLLLVNKPTQQAGIGVGNVRVSGANSVGITFSNVSTNSVIPTSPQTYAMVAIRGMPFLSPVLTPAAVASQTVTEQQFTVTGLRVGELVIVNKPTQQAGLDIMGCRVAAANTLGITFGNATTSTTAITPTAGETYNVFSLGGLDTVGNMIMIQAMITSTPVAVSSGTTTEVAITTTGVAATDSVIGVSKPTSQSNFGFGGYRATANAINLTEFSLTTSTTPTASEVYAIHIDRPNPLAQMIEYNVLLTPAIVNSQTTTEQAFTVTGLIANSVVWVNKPTATNGLGILGCRVSGTNSLAITYANPTNIAITPPAETYVIGNFQTLIPDAGNSWTFAASPVGQASSLLANAIRNALVAHGLIPGA